MPSVSLSIPIQNNFSTDFYKFINSHAQDCDWAAIRIVEENTHLRAVRNSRPEDNSVTFDHGAMIEVMISGAIGYAGTSDLSPEGLEKAFQKAKSRALESSPFNLFHFSSAVRPPSQGEYSTPIFKSLDAESLSNLNAFLLRSSKSLKVSDKIVNALAAARIVENKTSYFSTNGSSIRQNFLLLACNFAATAQDGGKSYTRSVNGPVARCVQLGLEAWDEQETGVLCQKAGSEALALLEAENCPEGRRDLILAPDQMLLQIHESIGHPLELDRILGDERNFAGWSFVKPEDFGKLQYGSQLMNVTFDPSVPGEFASYQFDDGGAPASREYLIKEGKLIRGLGGLESQQRLQLPGVANFRASSWNRAPIDRMANLNMEPGTSSFQSMIEKTENGIYMEANISWSIDDYRNKFQFGCEFGRLIEDGRLTKIVKNPNYRGMTIPFWNSLAAVGNAEELQIFGSPWCGKGEPSQIIRVGHASPPCLFTNVEVFGGGS